jgi:hypothetical protein
MPYHHLDATRTDDPHALPDVETFEAYALDCDHCDLFIVYPELTGTGYIDCPECGEIGITDDPHFYYAYGSPGCLWDSEPVGPYETEQAALEAAREDAGFCPHGFTEHFEGDDPCEDCSHAS